MSSDPEHADSTPEQCPETGRLMGFDFGTKRIGIAVSDNYQRIASPLHNYQRQATAQDERYFCQLTEEYEVVGLVIGLPVHMSGQESKKSREARSFGAWLHRRLGLPVDYHDERFSSLEADAAMLQANLSKKQRQARIDKVAAQFILQNFLDSRNADEKNEASRTSLS